MRMSRESLLKFAKVLHPEMILGLRGDPINQKLTNLLCNKIWYHPEQGYVVGFDSSWDPSSSFHDSIVMSWKFRETWKTKDRPGVYHSGKDFLKALSKIDREIPIDLLPERFLGYFSFPENTIWDGNDWIQGCYVFIGPPNETPLKKGYWPESEKVFWAVYISQADPAKPVLEVARILIDLRKEKFSDLAASYPAFGDPKSMADTNVFRLALNLVMYVNSINRDLIEAPPVRLMKPAEKKDRTKRGELINQCTVPITLISWNYQHPRVYTKESSWVDTFMRWQRCGPGNTQLKLIWVTPHSRHYKTALPVEVKEGVK
jgi:hypothetical protein